MVGRIVKATMGNGAPPLPAAPFPFPCFAVIRTPVRAVWLVWLAIVGTGGE